MDVPGGRLIYHGCPKNACHRTVSTGLDDEDLV